MSSKRLKILFDAGPLVNGAKSGVGYYAYRLLDAIASNYPEDIEIRAHYFNFLGRKKNLDLPQHPNITYIESKILPGKVLNLTRKLGLQLPLELFFKSRGDVAIFTNFVSLPSITKIPTIVAVHDLCYEDVPEYVSAGNREFLKRFVPRSIASASKVITISESTKKAIKKYYKTPDDKFILTPIPPVRTTIDNPQPPKGIDGSFILFISTLEPRKNFINLVRAYENLNPKIQQNYSLVLAGGKGWYIEDDLAYIKKLQDKGLKIIVPGYISDSEKEWLYQNASLFAFPSHYEGFGMPVLEAMQHNIPTVVSDIEVLREVAGDAAVYFDKDSPTSISQSIEEVLSSKTLQKQLIEKGTKRVKEFSWETVAADVFDAIKGLSKKS